VGGEDAERGGGVDADPRHAGAGSEDVSSNVEEEITTKARRQEEQKRLTTDEQDGHR
jgi:hypothetical protein